MLEGALDNVLSHLSHVGAKEKRLELASDRLKDLRLNVVNLLSESQDIDYAETIMNLKTEEFIYQTAGLVPGSSSLRWWTSSGKR